jgi:integrase
MKLLNQPITYLNEEEVKKLISSCKRERDKLLILVMYQSGLRISEALSLTPSSIKTINGSPALEIKGKREKIRYVALPKNLCDRLLAYAYKAHISPESRFFPINRHIEELGEL